MDLHSTLFGGRLCCCLVSFGVRSVLRSFVRSCVPAFDLRLFVCSTVRCSVFNCSIRVVGCPAGDCECSEKSTLWVLGCRRVEHLQCRVLSVGCSMDGSVVALPRVVSVPGRRHVVDFWDLRRRVET